MSKMYQTHYFYMSYSEKSLVKGDKPKGGIAQLGLNIAA